MHYRRASPKQGHLQCRKTFDVQRTEDLLGFGFVVLLASINCTSLLVTELQELSEVVGILRLPVAGATKTFFQG